jgi:AraC-like DNA-binding protein
MYFIAAKADGFVMQIERRKVHVESIPIEPQASLAVRHFQLNNFPFLWHCHSEIELTYIVEGTGLRFVGNTIEPYGTGDLCLLGSNLPHSWKSSVESGPVHSICVQFHEDRWGQPFLHLPELHAVRVLLKERATSGLHIVGKTASEVSKQMAQLGKEEPGSIWQLLMLIEALNFIATNAQDQHVIAAGAVGLAADDPGAVAIIQAITILNESMGDVLPSQSQIAERLNMSPSAFSRLFLRCVGKNYMDYLNEWRIGIACRALLETDDSIIDVSLTAGFENLSNFHRRFRNHKGMTPAQWRANARLPKEKPTRFRRQ